MDKELGIGASRFRPSGYTLTGLFKPENLEKPTSEWEFDCQVPDCGAVKSER